MLGGLKSVCKDVRQPNTTRFTPRTHLEPAGDLHTEKANASGKLVGGFKCSGGATVGTSGKSISLVGFTRLAVTNYIS
jgi:hypothetical protein